MVYKMECVPEGVNKGIPFKGHKNLDRHGDVEQKTDINSEIKQNLKLDGTRSKIN